MLEFQAKCSDGGPGPEYPETFPKTEKSGITTHVFPTRPLWKLPLFRPLRSV